MDFPFSRLISGIWDAPKAAWVAFALAMWAGHPYTQADSNKPSPLTKGHSRTADEVSRSGSCPRQLGVSWEYTRSTLALDSSSLFTAVLFTTRRDISCCVSHMVQFIHTGSLHGLLLPMPSSSGQWNSQVFQSLLQAQWQDKDSPLNSTNQTNFLNGQGKLRPK